MKVKPFRKIVPNDGTISQGRLFEIHSESSLSSTHCPTSDGIPLAPEKVPRLVNPKQYDAINYRRRVRMCIEIERLRSGRPVDGRRTGNFIYVGKHVHALRRARNPEGTFVQEGDKGTELNGFLSLGN